MSLYYALFITQNKIHNKHPYLEIANSIKDQGDLACIYLNMTGEETDKPKEFTFFKEVKKSNHCFCYTEAEFRRELNILIPKTAKFIITDIIEKSFNLLLNYLAQLYSLEIYSNEPYLLAKYKNFKAFIINNNTNSREQA